MVHVRMVLQHTLVRDLPILEKGIREIQEVGDFASLDDMDATRGILTGVLASHSVKHVKELSIVESLTVISDSDQRELAANARKSTHEATETGVAA